MIFHRIIPILLLRGSGIIKTQKFKKPIYLGDPLNAVKIFNQKEVDELIILDIFASIEKRGPDFTKIHNIATECFMPLAYGGGISTFEQARDVFNQGVEKVIINSNFNKPDLINSISKVYGSQSVIGAIDVKKNLFGKYEVYTHSGTKKVKEGLLDYAKKMEILGAGELFLQSIDKDGTMDGYDLDLIKEVSFNLSIPMIVAGGAGSINDFALAIKAGASAVGAGSLFVFKGKHKAVLISYPDRSEILKYVYEKK